MINIVEYISKNYKDIYEINVNNPKDDLVETEFKASLNKDQMICINNRLNSFTGKQIIQHLLFKYTDYIEYEITYKESSGIEKTYIKIHGGADIKNRNYKALRESYSSKYYLTDCGGYDVFLMNDGKVLTPLLQDMYRLVNPAYNESILDVGCGRGELSYFLAQKTNGNVLGIDYSSDSIKIATNLYGRSNLDNLSYECQDILQFDTQEKFDKVIMADVVEHIEQEQLQIVMKKIKSIMKSDGILFIHTAPNLDYYNNCYKEKVKVANELGAYLPTNPRTYYEELMHINEQTPNSLEQTLNKVFSYVKVWTGPVSSIWVDKSLDDSYKDIDIHAVATNSRDVYRGYMNLFEYKPEKNDISIDISCDNDKILGNRGERCEVNIIVKNNGNMPLNSYSRYPCNISYHIYDEQNNIIVFDGIRTKLKSILRKSMEEKISVSIDIPDNIENTDTKYYVEITLVAEAYFWFSDISQKYSKRISLEISE